MKMTKMINPLNKTWEKEYRNMFEQDVYNIPLTNQEVMQAYKDAMSVAVPVKVPISKE